MSGIITHKAGDSIRWNISYKQADEVTPVNLNGYEVIVNCTSRISGSAQLFTISSNGISSDRYITKDNFSIGVYQIIVKNTQSFPKGEYFVDIQYIDASGFKQSAKTFSLRIVERL